MRSIFALLVLLSTGDAVAKGEGGGISGFCFGQDSLAATVVRFPEERPEMVVVSTNFGILVSRDGGETFGWICPQTYGAQIAGNFTLFALPGVAALPDGTLFVLTGSVGYWISSEDSCRFDSAPDDDLRVASVVSVAAREAAPTTVFAAASWPGRGPFGVFRSDDDGATFAPTGLSSDGRLRFSSVYLTPGAERVYTTTRTEDGLVGVWRSDDRGDTWESGLENVEALSATIAGSGPSSVDDLYLEAVQAITGACDFEVALLHSADAGDSFEVLREKLEIPVGSLVRDDGSIWMAWKDSGIEVSQGGGDFLPLDGAPAPLGCMVAARDDDVAVCPLEGSPVLVSVRDHESGAFEPLVTLDKITGPLDCPANTPVGRDCGEAWAEFAAYWGLIESPDPDGGVAGVDAGPDPTADGGVALDAGSGGDGDGGDDSGCRVARGRSSTPSGGVSVALLALLWGRRRRRG